MRRPHRHRITLSITGRARTHAYLGSRPANGRQSEPRPSGITPSITGTPHHGRSYHALHHGHAAPRACEPRRHNGLGHDGGGTTGRQEARFVAFHQNRSVDHVPRTPNALPLSCAAPIDRESTWAKSSFQKRPDLARRAAASATAACWAAAVLACRYAIRCLSCTLVYPLTLSWSRATRPSEEVVFQPGLEVRVDRTLQPHHSVNHLGLEVRPLCWWQIT